MDSYGLLVFVCIVIFFGGALVIGTYPLWGW